MDKNLEEHISLFCIDNNIEDMTNNDEDINKIMDDLKNMQCEYQIDIKTESTFDNYNVNELLKICEYYGFLKYVKMAKYKKNDIIQSIEVFESSPENCLVVKKRQQLWYYMNELSNDKFMKKFVIWK
jgi:hypothetical protein